MRKLNSNNEGSVIPLILFIITIIASGALYTILIVEVAFPAVEDWLPATEVGTFIKMMIYAIPMVVLIIGTLALLLSGVKKEVIYFDRGDVY